MQGKLCGIYKITSPSKRVYIGQSIDIKGRMKYYRLLMCKKQPFLYRSIKKYGWDNHKFEIINLCTSDKLNDLEKYYVDLYQSFNTEFGLNLRDGGGGHGKMSNESRLKMSISGKGRIFSEEHKRKIGLAHKGKKLSTARVKFLKDRIVSEETRKKIGLKSIGRKARLGKLHSQETKDKISKTNIGKRNFSVMRAIIDISTRVTYLCKKEAAESCGIKVRTLKAKLEGKLKNNTPFRYA